MLMVPVSWSFERKTMLPIITCTGTSDKSIGEMILLSNALNYIKEAAKYQGIPVQEEYPKVQNVVTVNFSLMFPNEDALAQFKKVISPKN